MEYSCPSLSGAPLVEPRLGSWWDEFRTFLASEEAEKLCQELAMVA